MKLLFMGSGRFALPSLEALLGSPHALLGLVTQPDKPAGRGHELTPPPTKGLAEARGVPVYQPAKVRAPEVVERIRLLAPEGIVVVAYGQIIPRSILAIPPKGIINVHGSLLPAYRGAAPIQWAIVRGETETGVTTMLMDEGMDTGPILLQRKTPIRPEDTGQSLEVRLAILGAELLMETVAAWEAGALKPIPQDSDRATLAPRIKKQDALIDWTLTAREIERRVRGFIPWPVAHSSLRGVEVKIWSASAVDGVSGTPGETLSIERDSVLVASGSASALRLRELQAEGKRRMSAGELARGFRLTPGERWGSLSEISGRAR
jgi:methionyl-tRNA formyltransferase